MVMTKEFFVMPEEEKHACLQSKTTYIYDFPKSHMSSILKLEFYVVNSIIASIILCSQQVRDVEKVP